MTIMSGRNGQELLSTWVPADLAAAFRAKARSTDGGTSAALRRLVSEAVTGHAPAAPKGAGTGGQVGIRLKASERTALAAAARAHGTSPANWLRSLAIVHLTGQPQWNPEEVEELRSLFRELRAIGNNINQIAHVLNIAAQVGKYPPYQGAAAREAAELVRNEMRRIVSVMKGNFHYWGFPEDQQLMPDTFAIQAADKEAEAANSRKRNRPRRHNRGASNA